MEYGESIETEAKWLMCKKHLMRKESLEASHPHRKNHTNLWMRNIDIVGENLLLDLLKMQANIDNKCHSFGCQNNSLKAFWKIFYKAKEGSICKCEYCIEHM
jgi:hypothetical protein